MLEFSLIGNSEQVQELSKEDFYADIICERAAGLGENAGRVV